MGLSAGVEPMRITTGPRDSAMRNARVCYNHLAGNKGIQLHDALIANRYLKQNSGELVLTRKGSHFMQEFGIDLDSLQASRTPMCRPCLDWSERRSHLAGSLGRALMAKFEQLRWVKRDGNSRVVKFSAKGEREFNSTFSP